jgi:hypothetical protein
MLAFADRRAELIEDLARRFLSQPSRKVDAASSPEVPRRTLEGSSVYARFARYGFSKIGMAGVDANTLWNNRELPRHCAGDRLTKSRPRCCRGLWGQSDRHRRPLSPHYS